MGASRGASRRGARAAEGRSDQASSRDGDEARRRRRRSLRLRRARSLAALAVVAGIAFVVVHRSHTDGASGATSRPRAVATHYTVGVATCTFVDTSRGTHNYDTGGYLPGRTLVTEIRYPTLSGAPGQAATTGAHPAYRHGPFPLVVFAPGYDLTPDDYAALLDRWVRAGIVVAAPLFPDTNANAVAAQHGVDTEADIVNQPADVAFVVHRLTAADASGTGCPVVEHLIDPARLGLAGQSDGGDTVAAVSYESGFAEGLHPLATEVLSGALLASPSPSTPNAEVAGPPLLVVQSATDSCNPPEESTELYRAVPQSDKWFLALRSAHHLPPYTDSAEPADFALVASVTTDFFTLELDRKSPGAHFRSLAPAGDVTGSLTTGSPPALPSLETDSGTCYLS